MTILPLQKEREWLARVNAEAEFRLISRWTNIEVTLVRDQDARSYRIHEAVFDIADADSHAPEVVLTGSAAAWADFLAPVPPRHSHHVLAMDRRRDDFSVTRGRDELIRHLRVIDVVLQLMRDDGE